MGLGDCRLVAAPCRQHTEAVVHPQHPPIAQQTVDQRVAQGRLARAVGARDGEHPARAAGPQTRSRACVSHAAPTLSHVMCSSTTLRALRPVSRPGCKDRKSPVRDSVETPALTDAPPLDRHS